MRFRRVHIVRCVMTYALAAASALEACSVPSATPAPHAMSGVSVLASCPSPCAPLALMPWSAVKMYAVSPSCWKYSWRHATTTQCWVLS